ncbi:hypothetical protein ABIE62_000754 [Porphyrobacter sp. MBR-155]|jgi:hypothetical protein
MARGFAGAAQITITYAIMVVLAHQTIHAGAITPSD